MNKNTKNIFLGATACIAFIGSVFFPTEGAFQRLLSGIMFLGVFPFLVVRFVLRDNLCDFGWGKIHNPRKSLWLGGALFLIALGLFLILYAFTPLGNQFFPPEFLARNFFLFLLFGVLVSGVFSFIYSAFFGGFLQFWSEKYLGSWSPIVGWGCFVLSLVLTGALDWDAFLYIYAFLFSSLLASISRSLFGGLLFLWFFVVVTQLLLLKFF